MKSSLVPTQSSEQIELEQKKRELAAVEAELVERELDLGTLEAELRAFERRYLRSVGVLYAELDDIEAQITEQVARQNPNNSSAQRHASECRSKAKESDAASRSVPPLEEHDDFKPSEDIKKLYRELAKKIHPDLATDESDRESRTKLMSEANSAYATGDMERLRAILNEWESSPERIQGEGVGVDLIRMIRKIAQIQVRLNDIHDRIEKLKRSELFVLREKVRAAEQDGRELLREIAESIRARISDERVRLSDIQKGETIR